LGQQGRDVWHERHFIVGDLGRPLKLGGVLDDQVVFLGIAERLAENAVGVPDGAGG